MGDIVANLRIDTRLQSYESFFDHDWAKRISKLVSGTRLVEPVDELGIYWKSVANAYRTPWLMIEVLKQWATGFANAQNLYSPRVVNLMRDKIISEMGNDLPPIARDKLSETIERVGDYLRQMDKKATQMSDVGSQCADGWHKFVETSEFRFSLWSLPRLCYSGVFFGYENFVRTCNSLATSKPSSDDWIPGGELMAELKAIFGDQFVSDVIADSRVHVARLVRNALVHGGGKVSKELRSLSHGIALEQDVLQIMPRHVVCLFNDLKERAFKLAEQAIKLPCIGNST